MNRRRGYALQVAGEEAALAGNSDRVHRAGSGHLQEQIIEQGCDTAAGIWTTGRCAVAATFIPGTHRPTLVRR
jgi:hypothetical protein